MNGLSDIAKIYELGEEIKSLERKLADANKIINYYGNTNSYIKAGSKGRNALKAEDVELLFFPDAKGRKYGGKLARAWVKGGLNDGK